MPAEGAASADPDGTAPKAQSPPAPVPAAGSKSPESLSAYDRERLEAAVRGDEQFTKSLLSRKAALLEQTLARGEELMRSSPFERAGRALAVAYALDPQPQLLFRIAQAYQKAKQDSTALAFFQRFLQDAPDSPQQKEASDFLAGLRARTPEPDAALERASKEHLDLGKTYYQAAQYREAAEAFAVVYALKRAPRYLFNLGQGYRRAGEPYAAYFYYQRYLQEEPQTPVRRETEGYLADLRMQLSQPPVRTSRRNWVIGGVAIAGGIVALALGLGLGLGLRNHDPATDGGTVLLHF